MTRRKVKSTNIRSIGHEGTVLEVEFHDGAIYQYHGVSPNRAAALMRSESKGSYLAERIIPKYEAKKIN